MLLRSSSYSLPRPLPLTPRARRTRRRARLNGFRYALPEALSRALDTQLAIARRDGWIRRLWARDASLWTGRDESQWLGWLEPAARPRNCARLSAACMRLREAGYADAVVLGMGGASLGSEVLAGILRPSALGLSVHVLDSTDVEQIRQVESRIDPLRCLFVVASKSGATLESRMLASYFQGRLCGLLGRQEAGRRFIAITDPGTPLHRQALQDGYAAVFEGEPSVGGRYSALSAFGLVTLALLGHDPGAFLRDARPMLRACSVHALPRRNPGLVLGVLLGVAARAGRDKATLLSCPGLEALGAWLEQLLAESTGKNGVGIVPVDGEPPGRPADYGPDRLFIQLRQPRAPCAEQDALCEALERAGRPVLRFDIAGPGSLGQEFFRWEVATAIAGAVLGVNPFDQPDVEASKRRAGELAARRAGGVCPQPGPAMESPGLRLYGDVPAAASVEEALARHVSLAGPGGYVALLAYLPRDARHGERLAAWRRLLRSHTGAATMAGFGPRYLHSCGQLHKGGPGGGVFLFLTAEREREREAPGHALGFAATQAAQALGDMEELRARGRPCLRVHLRGGCGAAGLEPFDRALRRALGRAGSVPAVR